MRAVRSTLGRPDVLYIADVDVSVLGPGQVLVRVRAAGLNPARPRSAPGALASRFPATFPPGEGSDFAWVVTAAGDGTGEVAIRRAIAHRSEQAPRGLPLISAWRRPESSRLSLPNEAGFTPRRIGG